MLKIAVEPRKQTSRRRSQLFKRWKRLWGGSFQNLKHRNEANPRLVAIVSRDKMRQFLSQNRQRLGDAAATGFGF